jgi:hypothetical protein
MGERPTLQSRDLALVEILAPPLRIINVLHIQFVLHIHDLQHWLLQQVLTDLLIIVAFTLYISWFTVFINSSFSPWCWIERKLDLQVFSVP